MAIISVKGRKEGINVDRHTAVSVKNRWLGVNNTPKAQSTDVVDLGDWAGEYGAIRSIELDKEMAVAKTKAVYNNKTNTVKIVSLDYKLNEDERLA